MTMGWTLCFYKIFSCERKKKKIETERDEREREIIALIITNSLSRYFK